MDKAGSKHDAGKNRLDLIPSEAVLALGEVLTFGCEKYSANNWRQGINYSRVYSAIQRHLNAFWGESADIDEESRLSHLSHAFCGLSFLITYEENKERYQTFDDRAGSNNKFYKQREETIDDICGLVQNNMHFFGAKIGDSGLEKAYDKLLMATQTILYTDDPPFGFPDLTKMTNEEACKHLKPGMRVRVLRSASAGEGGWSNIWTSKMCEFVGKTCVIDGVNTAIGVCFTNDYWGSFPAFVLEIISRPDQDLTTPNEVPDGDSSCTKDWKDR